MGNEMKGFKSILMERRTPLHAGVAVVALAAAFCLPAEIAVAQTSSKPWWMYPVWKQALAIPALKGVTSAGTKPPIVIPQSEQDVNPAGTLGTFQPNGPTRTSTNAFFLPLGTNGRTCFSCHQPPNGMSISASAIQKIFANSHGNDPIFAPVDGANCPNTPHNHSLLLNKGLFRIFLPVPANAEYTLEVVSDPTGCNTNSLYNYDPTTGATIVSVYRRPLPAGNLKFLTTTVPDIVVGIPSALPIDPFTGRFESGNIMWDGREATLESQAIDATLGHAQAKTAPSAQQVAQIVAFENGVYSAQINDKLAGYLNANGVSGGPVNLSLRTPTCVNFLVPGTDPYYVCDPAPIFDEYNAWGTLAGASPALSQRESIYRGMLIFNGVDPNGNPVAKGQFTIFDVSGFNNLVFASNPFPGGNCGTCHGAQHAGSGMFQSLQFDIGIGGTAGSSRAAPNPTLAGGTGFGPAPSPDLPIFKLTCNSGATRYRGPVVYTNDPGQALISGKCFDIGQLTVPPLRGLASRAPFFSDGSAAAMSDVVTFYNNRFNMGLSSQDQRDLANFLNAL
jgi:cytochrome c peroxidase